MSAALRIISPGLATTVQDLGRPGFQRLGVAPSGALDPVALRVANALVGNPANAGALEALYLGPSFAVEAETARLAFVGADAAIEILADAEASSGETVPSMQSVRVRCGQVVRVGSLRNGATLYIAVEGGFAIVPVLGSVATDTHGKIGGWHGRALREGDVLPLRRALATGRNECRVDGLNLDVPSRLRVVLGPQSDFFPDAEVSSFIAGEYTVTAAANRMGMRLEGKPIRHIRGFNIVSDAIATGSIQVPGDGHPIVLLADHQTTGGYPKIATVISADLPALGRLSIGQKVSFTIATTTQTIEARRDLVADLGEIGRKIIPIAPPSVPDASRLFELNLISGVYDAGN